MDYNSGIGHARREGIREEITKGETIGERKKQIEVAKKMKAKNIDINTIIEVTELTKEEIEKL